ncbi:uncharacterized [Tachysurus ichikawai]
MAACLERLVDLFRRTLSVLLRAPPPPPLTETTTTWTTRHSERHRCFYCFICMKNENPTRCLCYLLPSRPSRPSATKPKQQKKNKCAEVQRAGASDADSDHEGLSSLTCRTSSVGCVSVLTPVTVGELKLRFRGNSPRNGRRKMVQNLCLPIFMRSPSTYSEQGHNSNKANLLCNMLALCEPLIRVSYHSLNEFYCLLVHA